MIDERIRAGVLLALAGIGGESLTPFAAEHFSFMNPDFAEMTQPSLIVAGGRDQSPLSTRGPDWWTDAYAQSPSHKALLTLIGAEHTMGGIAGYSTHEISDWNLDRIALLQQISTAYLRDALDIDGTAWANAREALASSPEDGRLQTK